MNRRSPFSTGLLVGLLLLSVAHSAPVTPDITVAADGSGDYKKVQDAINAVNASGKVIFIKPGTYKEQIRVTSNKKNLKIIGASYETTTITFNADASSGRDTHASAIISGEDFYAEQVTFQNTVDSRVSGSQAEALRVDGDRAVFYKCKITGFQDTYRNDGYKRSYHKECIIEGTTDFIYGNGIALFEDCTINNRKNSHVTAANHALINGSDPDKFGYVFKNCKIMKHPDETVTGATLGRPWGNAARVVYLNCEIGAHIKSDGWSTWNDNTNHTTSYFAEYKSTGPGANPAKRLSWTHQLTDAEAAGYTKENIFKANTTSATKLNGDWNPVIEGTTGITGSGRPVSTTVPNSIVPRQSAPSTVTYNVSRVSHVRLRMYDLHGREVAVSFDGTVVAGSHTVRDITATLSKGVYIPRLSINAGDDRQTTEYTLTMIRLE
jgi:pectinesterase